MRQQKYHGRIPDRLTTLNCKSVVPDVVMSSRILFHRKRIHAELQHKILLNQRPYIAIPTRDTAVVAIRYNAIILFKKLNEK